MQKTEVLKKPELRDSVKAIAHDIAAEVSHHIEIMFPAAVRASPSTFLLSVRGCIYNEMMFFLDPKNVNEVKATLKSRAEFRRKMKAFYRTLRKEEGNNERITHWHRR